MKFIKLLIICLLGIMTNYGMKLSGEACSSKDADIHPAVILINDACDNLKLMQDPDYRAANSHFQFPFMFDALIEQLQLGVHSLQREVEKHTEQLPFNRQIGLTTQRFLSELDTMTTNLSKLEDDTEPFDIKLNKLLQLKETIFKFLSNIKPSHQAHKTSLIKETLQGLTHFTQSPEALEEIVPKEQDTFQLKNLIPALTKTGLAIFHNVQQKKCEEKTVTELTEETHSIENALTPITHYTLEEAAHLTSIAEEKSQTLLDKQAVKDLRDAAKFVVEPEATPLTLSFVQKIPTLFLSYLPVPTTAIDTLKRPKGFKPSDIARISEKLGEEFDITPEQRKKAKEHVESFIKKNEDTITSTTKKFNNLLQKAKKSMYTLTIHAQQSQQKEREELEYFSRLGKANKQWQDLKSTQKK